MIEIRTSSRARGSAIANIIVVLLIVFLASAFIPVYVDESLRDYLSTPVSRATEIQNEWVKNRVASGEWPNLNDDAVQTSDSIEYLGAGSLKLTITRSEIENLGFLVSMFHAESVGGKAIKIDVIERDGKFYRSCFSDVVKLNLLPPGCDKWEDASDDQWTEIHGFAVPEDNPKVIDR